MSVSVDDIRDLLNLDEEDDTALVEGYLVASKLYIKNAVGGDDKFFEQKNIIPLYDVAVKALTGTYYQYRIALADTQNYAIDLTLNSIIGQLRGLYASYEEDKND